MFPEAPPLANCLIPGSYNYCVMQGNIYKLLALLPLSYVVVAFLGQDVTERRRPAAELTAGWAFAADTFVGSDPAAYDHLAPAADGLHPGLPWREQPALTDVAGGTFVYRWHAPDTNVRYGLRVPAFYGAYRVYFDGREVGGRGTPSLDADAHADFVASEVLVLPRRARVDIAFEAATHDVYPGGAASAFVVDEYAFLRSTQDRVIALTLFVVGLLTAIGFTVFAASWGSPATERQRSFGALVIAVAGFVAFNDTALLASQWLVVPYAYTYRLHLGFLFASVALAWTYAAESGGAVGFPRVRRGLLYVVIAAAAAAMLLPIAYSSRVLPLVYVPIGLGSLLVGYLAVASGGWRAESAALTRVSLLALVAGVVAAAVAEIGVDQALGLLTLL